MASISARENQEIEAANTSGNTPAVDFVKRFA
jgi:hypothetical protein